MEQKTLTREQVTKAYEIFQDVSGGLSTGWIFKEGSPAGSELGIMIGKPVSGDTYSELCVTLPALRDDQLKKWEARKREVYADIIEEIPDEKTMRIGFKAKQKDADQLEKLSPGVEADKPADTTAESEE